MKLQGNQIGAFVAIILGLLLAFLPVQSRQIVIKPGALARTITGDEYHIDPETVSKWLVEGNEDFLLIDVRSPEEFAQGHIKNAINIPLPELIKPETIDELDTDKLIILYSNGISHAIQAWVVLHAADISDVVVLEGGLNYWNKYILNPKPPGQYASNDEILIYKSKAAIAGALGGGNLDIQSQTNQPTKHRVFHKKSKKKKRAEGGC
ncbi:MAG: rhodanese-like domain-containing protein [Calditrichaeota bacterium]|nr:rhodanese-like domain-containing protein [Calditrichota bacterium]